MIRALALLLASVLSAGAQDVTRLLELKQQEQLHALDLTSGGVLGVATIDLTSGRTFIYNGDAVFPTASSIKLAILIQMFRSAHAGRFSFDDQVTLGAKDNAGGSDGPLQEALDKGPVKLTIRELVDDMIVYSDNSATNRSIDLVGMDAVNRLLTSFNLKATRLRRKMMDTAAAARGDENVSTPLELARLLEMIYRGTAADPASCHEMLKILKRVNAYLRPVIPASVEVASKPGELDGVRCEAGIVYLPKRPFIVNVMSTYLDDSVNPVGPAAQIVFNYFAKLAQSNQYGRRL